MAGDRHEGGADPDHQFGYQIGVYSAVNIADSLLTTKLTGDEFLDCGDVSTSVTDHRARKSVWLDGEHAIDEGVVPNGA